jgi:metal-dependent amidase/aminoacylase/carboxypeptidase family protein
MLPKWMKQMVDNVCSAYGCKAEFKYEKSCSPVINEAVSTELVKKSVTKVIGEENVIQIPPVMGSEDFSTYLEKVPGAFMILGGGNSEKGWMYSQHSNHFTIDEDCLVVGASVYARAALDFLQN